MKMQECPKFDRCFAPICPLDPNWTKRVHTGEDRICLFLLESVKEGAETRLEPTIMVACRVLYQSPELPGTIRARTEKAAHTGSRIERMKQVREAGLEGKRLFELPEVVPA